MLIDKYRRLWDGSEPGWTLRRFDLIDWSIVICFADTGPTQTEILAIRQLVDEFRNVPISEVYRELKGSTVYTLPRELGNIDMRRFIDSARQLGLNVTANAIDRSGYLPVSSAGHALVIEDNELSAEVAERMIAAGVPVTEVHID